jgi:uncharacterized protein YgfB (UPF0149 family)
MPKPTFDLLEETLILAGALSDPAELHGQLCGLACVLGGEAGAPWVTESLADASGSTADRATAKRLLSELAGETLSALDEADMSLAALLPDDEEPLDRRTRALGHWCQGFLHGLGVAARNDTFLKIGTTGEIVADFSEITRAVFSEDEDVEEAESAYAELVEFVRVSAQLVFEELEPLRTRAAGQLEH